VTPAEPSAPPVRIYVTRRGSGAPIIFLHGLGTSSSSWDQVIAALPDRFLTVAADLIGHGQSPVPAEPNAYTREQVLVDIDGLVAVAGGRPVLVGHSLGGYLSLAYAATRPAAVRGLVLVNTGPGFRDPLRRQEWNDRSRRNADRFGVPPQVAELNLQEDSLVIDRLASIDVPTLVVAGSRDRPEFAAGAAYLERRMPRATAVVLDGEHSLHEHSHSADVAVLIAEFVDRLDDERASTRQGGT
jgi:pimeloyl-ACP methyl ester carboxylesterase